MATSQTTLQIRGPVVVLPLDEYLEQQAQLEEYRKLKAIYEQELARAIGRRSSSVSYNVRALVREGLLRTERDGRRLRCFPAEESAA